MQHVVNGWHHETKTLPNVPILRSAPDSQTIVSRQLTDGSHPEEQEWRKQQLIVRCMRGPATQQSSPKMGADHEKHRNSRFQKETSIVVFRIVGLCQMTIGCDAAKCVPADDLAHRIVVLQVLLRQAHSAEERALRSIDRFHFLDVAGKSLHNWSKPVVGGRSVHSASCSLQCN